MVAEFGSEFAAVAAVEVAAVELFGLKSAVVLG